MDILQEVVAVQSVLGEEACSQLEPEHHHAAAQLLFQGDHAAAEALLAVHPPSPTSLTLICHPHPHPSDGNSHPATRCTAELHLTLDPVYPSLPARAVVTSSGCSRAWCDSVTKEVQQLAGAAAAQECPCMHDLVEAVQRALASTASETAHGDQLRSPNAPASGPAGPAAPAGTSAAAEAAAASARAAAGPASVSQRGSTVQVKLLKLDHMHNKVMYCRTIKSWTSELGLTGCLIFCNSLILILLEGPPEDVKEYLVRHRTETVDVDSRGRKCRERMMDIVAEASRASRSFASFREVTVGALQDVEEVLAIAGIQGWLRAAAGLEK